MEYAIPKGVFDILPCASDPKEAWRSVDRWQYLESTARETAREYGYKEIRTPMFERTELFVRGVGESSDIVTKEMYTFLDKADRSMTLRPEGTASVMRSFVENRLDLTPGLHKFFYIGPMFRYERPQSGRYRQHHQFGAEAVGCGKPEQDVELIDMLCEFYRRLGLKNLTVMLNTVGDESSRTSYRAALTQFLKPHFDSLSEESKVRFTKNILRILDSKDPADQKLLSGAPSIHDFLSAEAKDHFEQVKKWLASLKLTYVVNPNLVRGLDYYNKTVFEITSGELGAQNTVVGGGRYDGLIKSLGGPDLPSVGFASGIERVLQTMAGQGVAFPARPRPFIFFVPLGQEALDKCFELVCALRHAKIPAEIDLAAKKVQHGLQLASAEEAVYSAVVGDRELQTGEIELKEMATRQGRKTTLAELVPLIKELYHV